MRSKIHIEKKKYESLTEDQLLKTLISTGDSYFKFQSLKIGINLQHPPCLETIYFPIAPLKVYKLAKRQAY